MASSGHTSVPVCQGRRLSRPPSIRINNSVRQSLNGLASNSKLLRVINVRCLWGSKYRKYWKLQCLPRQESSVTAAECLEQANWLATVSVVDITVSFAVSTALIDGALLNSQLPVSERVSRFPSYPTSRSKRRASNGLCVEATDKIRATTQVLLPYRRMFDSTLKPSEFKIPNEQGKENRVCCRLPHVNFSTALLIRACILVVARNGTFSVQQHRPTPLPAADPFSRLFVANFSSDTGGTTCLSQDNIAIAPLIT